MRGPYRAAFVDAGPRRRALDPWKLALIFAWVCDIERIGLGLIDRRPITGELGFGALLGLVTMIVMVVSARRHHPWKGRR
jgi:hypothetical protein